MQKGISGKILAVLIAAVLVFGGAVGGTVAWLIAETDEVVNTFTFGNIGITLDETKLTPNGEYADENGDLLGTGEEPIKTTVGNSYNIVPGKTYLKDPAVTVESGSEACWLFVTVLEEGASVVDEAAYDFGDFISYEMLTEWNVLTEKGAEVKTAEGAKVYYRTVTKTEEDAVFKILKEDKVSVLETVTKPMVDGITDQPTLTFVAYAVQYSGFEPQEGETVLTAALKAWKKAESDS